MRLPVDPEVADVRLGNGLRLWTRRHPGRDGGVAMALHVHAGSLGETDDERGLSHLIEHLAFSGGERFGAGELIPLFARHGTVLGQDHNASTGFEWTAFTLSFPRASALEDGLAVLADFASGLTFPTDALETERKVVLEEMRHLDSADARIRRRLLAEMAPSSRLVRRRPLGVPETVSGFRRETVLAYHRRWYRPERCTLVVVGDVEPDVVEADVRRLLESWAGTGAPPPEETLGDPGLPGDEPTSGDGERALVLEDPELRAAEIRRLRLRRRRRPGSLEVFREELGGRIALWIVDQRLIGRIREGRVSFQDAAFGIVPLLDAWALDQAVARAPSGRADSLAGDFLREIRRAVVHPFADDDLRRAIGNLLRATRREVATEETAPPARILRELSTTVPVGRPPMSRGQRLELLEDLVPRLDSQEVHRIFGARFGGLGSSGRPGVTAIVLAEGSPAAAALAGSGPGGLSEIVRRTDRESPDPPPVRTSAEARVPRLPPAGSISSREEEAELGILHLDFANGVHAHLRSMDRRPGRFHVEVSLAGGRLWEDSETFGLTGAAAIPFTHLATDEASAEDTRAALVDAELRLGASVGEDAVVLRLSGPSESLMTGLRVLHGLLSCPRVDPGMLRLWQRQVEGREDPLPETVVAHETARLLSGSDPRFGRLTAARARAIDLRAARDWLDDLRLSPTEVAVVGDLDREAAAHLVARCFGSLEGRRRDFSDLRDPDLRRLPEWTGPLESTLTAASGAEMERAALLDGWRAAPWNEPTERRRLQLATRVLALRLHREIRERRHLAYSVRSSYSPSPVYPAASLLSVSLYAEPRRAEEASVAVRATVADLAEKGPRRSELSTVGGQAAELAERVEADPKYWARMLAQSVYRQLPAESFRGLPDRLRAVGVDDVKTALAQCIVESRRLSVLCTPTVRPTG